MNIWSVRSSASSEWWRKKALFVSGRSGNTMRSLPPYGIVNASRLSAKCSRNSESYRVRRATDLRRGAASAAPFLILVGALAIFAACTGEPPLIGSVRYSVLAVEDREADIRYETLSVFAAVSSPDGYDDLETWRVRHPGSEAYWELTSAEWTLGEWDDRTWIGADGLFAPDGYTVPRGRYELAVEDLAGRRAETHFEVRTLGFALEDAVFPELIREGEQLRVEPTGNRLRITITDSEGAHISTFDPASHRIDSDELDERIEDGSARLYLSSHVERSDVWLISGPWMWPQ